MGDTTFVRYHPFGLGLIKIEKMKIMSKTSRDQLWRVFIVNIIVFLFAGCNVTFLGLTPTPQFVHYSPSIWFDTHLEFDYPSSWTFSEDNRGTVSREIVLADPRFLTLPTPDYRIPDQIILSDYGSVLIRISPISEGETSNSTVASLKQNYQTTNGITAINDYRLTIDGYTASVLEYLIDDKESYTSIMFIRRIYFVLNDQMYQIRFRVSDKERGGEFEQGYEYFFDSLRILP